MRRHEKFLKLFVWGVILFVFAYGIISILIPIKPRIYKEMYKEAAIEKDKAKAIAVAFTREFFSFSALNADDKYYQRVVRYFPKFKDDSKSGWQRTEDVLLWDFEKISDKSAYVTVLAETLRGDEKNLTGVSEETWVKVPVAAANNNYYVSDYPLFIAPDFVKLDDENKEKIEKVDKDTETEIEEYLKGFFTIYDKCSSDQIMYFFKNKNDVKGYENKFKFEKIEDMQAFKRGEMVQVKIIISVSRVSESVPSITKYKQSFNILMKKDDKWYINKILELGG
jgi:hypothetical protein